MRKITALLREYVLGLSIITIIIGLFLLLMGIIYYWFKDVKLGFYTDIIMDLGEWNAFILIAGLIILGIGIYYFYSYYTQRKFVVEEIQTNKRSEFLKRHKEVKVKVKHLPSKYQELVKNKEKELKIK